MGSICSCCCEGFGCFKYKCYGCDGHGCAICGDKHGGLPSVSFDPRADRISKLQDDHLRNLRKNTNDLSKHAKEIKLTKKLSHNKVTGDLEINKLVRNQNEIAYQMKNIADMSNAELNKLNNVH